MENSLVFYFISNLGSNFCFTRTKICLPWWFWGSKIDPHAWKLHAFWGDLNSIDMYLNFPQIGSKISIKICIQKKCMYSWFILIKFYAYSVIRNTYSQNTLKSKGYLTVLQIDFAIKDLFWNVRNTQRQILYLVFSS